MNACVHEKVLVLFQESFIATPDCDYNFPAIASFSARCFSGGTCRADKIKMLL